MTERSINVVSDTEKKVPTPSVDKTPEQPVVVTTAVLEPAVASASLQRMATAELTLDLKEFLAEQSLEIKEFQTFF